MTKISKSKILTPFLILAIIMLLIFFNTKGWLAQPKSILYEIAKPPLRAWHWLGNKIAGGLSFFIIMGDLARENKLLKGENQRLFAENIRLQEVALENENLRKQLALGPPEEKSLVLANLIARHRTAQAQTFLIDRGSKDGLAQGQAVIAGGGYLVGRITEVNRGAANVLPITDSNSVVNVRVQKTRASGVVRGEHGLGLVMEMIPQEHQLKEGELVITSGLGGVFSRGLIVGQVSEIISSATEVFKKARIKPLVDFNKLEIVFVIK